MKNNPMTISNNVDIAQYYYEQLSRYLIKYIEDNGELTPVNITLYITKLMIFIQTISNLKGGEKKELVIRVINTYISQIRNIETKTDLQNFSNLFLSSIIDTIVDVNNKKIVIKKPNLLPLNFLCCFQIK